MAIGRGLHQVSESDVDRLARELHDDSYDVFVLTGSISGTRSFFAAVRASMPLDPPLVGDKSWDALADSLWGGIDRLPVQRVALVWPASGAMAKADPEGYAIALEILRELPSSFASPTVTAGETKEVAVLLGR